MCRLRTTIVVSFISTTTLCVTVVVGSLLRAAQPENDSLDPVRWTSLSVGATKDQGYRKVAVQGRVAFLGDVLQRRFGVQTVREARQRVLVLETTDDKLMPIVEDLRGRSFRKDPRLREMDVQLDARQYDGSQLLQVLRICEIKDQQKFELDYWCDVCAIVMFEDGPCDCCQDHNRLRKRPVDPKKD